jgi:hypothetical protein
MNEMTPKEISKLLELADPEGSRPFDRLEKGKPVAPAKEAVAKSGLKPLVQAALYLYFDCFEEAHNIANDHEGSVEGNWIHAIVHRREPDAGNSKYWYARVHIPAKTSQDIAREVLVFGEGFRRGGPPRPPGTLGLAQGPAPTPNHDPEVEKWFSKMGKSGKWEPEVFVDLCDQFRKKDPSTGAYRVLAKIQEIEWRGLLGMVM